MTDARVETIVRRSAAYRWADAMIEGVERAWNHSRTRRLSTIAGADRIRFWATTTIVAAVTAIVLSLFGTTPRPVTWLLPAVAFAIGLLVVVLAPRR